MNVDIVVETEFALARLQTLSARKIKMPEGTVARIGGFGGETGCAYYVFVRTSHAGIRYEDGLIFSHDGGGYWRLIPFSDPTTQIRDELCAKVLALCTEVEADVRLQCRHRVVPEHVRCESLRDHDAWHAAHIPGSGTFTWRTSSPEDYVDNEALDPSPRRLADAARALVLSSEKLRAVLFSISNVLAEEGGGKYPEEDHEFMTGQIERISAMVKEGLST